MTRHHEDLGSAFESLRSKGEGGGGKKEKKEGGRKKRRGDWGKKEGNARYHVTPFCLPLRTLASANSYCVNQTIEQACSANQTGDFS